MWKITDFGITCEGTSQTMRSSKDGKGTSGYRAPELMADGKSGYNNKVDIWSMGCILYELAVGRQTFCDDLAAMEHKRSQRKLDIVLDEFFSKDCKESITKNITAMIQIEASSRPSATDLLVEFRYNYQFSVAQGPMQTIPTSIDNHSVLYKNAIEKEPFNYWLWHNLCKLLIQRDDLDEAIRTCQLGIETSEDNPSPLMELSNLYAAKGDYGTAIKTSMKLARIKPANFRLALTEPGHPLLLPDFDQHEMQRLLKR